MLLDATAALLLADRAAPLLLLFGLLQVLVFIHDCLVDVPCIRQVSFFLGGPGLFVNRLGLARKPLRVPIVGRAVPLTKLGLRLFRGGRLLGLLLVLGRLIFVLLLGRFH